MIFKLKLSFANRVIGKLYLRFSLEFNMLAGYNIKNSLYAQLPDMQPSNLPQSVSCTRFVYGHELRAPSFDIHSINQFFSVVCNGLP